MDKAQLRLSFPVTVDHQGQKKTASIRRKAAWILITLALAYVTISHITPTLRMFPKSHVNYAEKCAQPAALFPQKNAELDKAFEFISSQSFKNATIERLSGAVKIKTETFDDLGRIGVDRRWEVFYSFHDYLKTSFPLVHERLQVEKINTHGLLYTWQGSRAELKPMVLLAHQDTVPVPIDTIASWKYPPVRPPRSSPHSTFSS
jgi:Gly-Xaa carboxypeptidase